MTYGSEAYLSYHRDNERVASMVRSITQDGCRNFNEKTIKTIFISKTVNNVDIGKICSDLVMTIAGSLKIDEENSSLNKEVENTVEELLILILLDYLDDINPNEDIIWKIKWLTKGVPLLSKKINTLPGTGKVAPMASLEKPTVETRRDIKDVKW